MIASALEESIEIFKAFDFLEASGNLMVIFTDGEDTTSIVHGRSLDDILKSAVDNKIPLYFVRTNYDKEFGEGIPDAEVAAAVEKTGGRYYVARRRSEPDRRRRRHRSRSGRRDSARSTRASNRASRCLRSRPSLLGRRGAAFKLAVAAFHQLP